MQSGHDSTLRKGFQRLQENNKNLLEHSSPNGQAFRTRMGVGSAIGPTASQHQAPHQQQKHPSVSQDYLRPGKMPNENISRMICYFSEIFRY